jgi:hypothetical protein
MATVVYRISHNDTKHADKCSNNNKNNKNNIETIWRSHRQILFQDTVKVAQETVSHKVYTYYTRTIQQTVGRKDFCTYEYYESFLNIKNPSTG